MIATLQDVFARFETAEGKAVVDFVHPRLRPEVREHRTGGWPTVSGPRIIFDTVAALTADGSISPAEVEYHYPSLSEAAARDAIDFAGEVSNPRPLAVLAE